jgi:hypothetical protein
MSAQAHSRDQLEACDGYVQVEAEKLASRYVLRLPNPEATAALERSIARHGVLHPLTVNREEDGTLSHTVPRGAVRG